MAAKNVRPAFLGAILIVAFTVVGLALWHGRRALDKAADLDDAIAAYRSAGLPWEARDLDPNPAIPRAEDATPFLMDALSQFDDSMVKQRVAVMRSCVSRRDFDALNVALAPYDQPLARAARAAQLGRAFFAGDRDHLPLLFQQFSKTRFLAILFGYTASLYALHHDSGDCIYNLKNGFRLASFLEQQPDPEKILFEESADVSLFRLCTVCAAEFMHDPATLLRISELVESRKGKPDPIGYLRSAVYPGVALLRNVEYYGGEAKLRDKLLGSKSPDEGQRAADFLRSGAPLTTDGRAYLDDYLRFWLSVLPRQLKEQGDPVDASSDLHSAADAWAASRGTGDLDCLLMPTTKGRSVLAYDSAAGIYIAVDWTRQVTTDGLIKGLIIFAKTGRMPARLGDIAGVWHDPFRPGQELLLKSGKDFLRVYSTGPDKIDDGGVDVDEMGDAGNGDYDIVASYPPVQKKKPT